MAQKESREFHKHFDATHKLDYFYEVKTGESHWEIPKDCDSPVIIDKTQEAEETAQVDKEDPVEQFKK